MYQIDFHKPIAIHFIGIGGISMSGLAEVLLDLRLRRKKKPADHSSRGKRGYPLLRTACFQHQGLC